MKYNFPRRVNLSFRQATELGVRINCSKLKFFLPYFRLVIKFMIVTNRRTYSHFSYFFIIFSCSQSFMHNKLSAAVTLACCLEEKEWQWCRNWLVNNRKYNFTQQYSSIAMVKCYYYYDDGCGVFFFLL